VSGPTEQCGRVLEGLPVVAWIESHQELAHHPKVARLANMLDITVPAAIGHLHCLWWWVLSYADDGDVSEFDAFEIAHGAQWTGDADEFVACLTECGWMDGGEVHDWHEYAGKLVERRRQDAERKRNARQKTSEARPVDVLADGVRTNQPNQPTNSSTTEFGVFHRERAVKEVDRRAAAGLEVKNRNGLAFSIAGDPDFQKESARIWEHRDCETCKGTGILEVYAPGAGTVKTECKP
jgi:hypothetical protein